MTGVSDFAAMDAQMELAAKLIPQAKHVGLIYCSSEVNSEVQANQMKDYCKKHDLAVEERTVNNVNDIQQVAESLIGKVDYIYVPTDNTLASSIPTLMKITDANKIPVIVGADIMAKGRCAGSALGRLLSPRQADGESWRRISLMAR